MIAAALFLLALIGVNALLIWLMGRVPLSQRITEKQCAQCGYNLRGITSDRCPECGTVLLSSNIIKPGDHLPESLRSRLICYSLVMSVLCLIVFNPADRIGCNSVETLMPKSFYENDIFAIETDNNMYVVAQFRFNGKDFSKGPGSIILSAVQSDTETLQFKEILYVDVPRGKYEAILPKSFNDLLALNGHHVSQYAAAFNDESIVNWMRIREITNTYECLAAIHALLTKAASRNAITTANWAGLTIGNLANGFNLIRTDSGSETPLSPDNALVALFASNWLAGVIILAWRQRMIVGRRPLSVE